MGFFNVLPLPGFMVWAAMECIVPSITKRFFIRDPLETIAT
jgi:hypothetical protein